ncbi:MAG: FIST N-terminal domain-containing protein [candidate division NC10 bacterium]|nr:FIST N-terminal domain-containing protein [candidate division NC10 bacterium]
MEDQFLTRRDFMKKTFQYASAAALAGSALSLEGLGVPQVEAGGGDAVLAAAGYSVDPNPRTAGREAAAMAKEKVKKPTFAMVFADPPHKDFDSMLAGVTSVIGNQVPLVGQTTGYAGGYSICPAGCIPKSVAVLLLESPYLKIGIGLGTGCGKNPRAAAKKATLDALRDLNYNPAKDLQKVKPGPALAKHHPYTVMMMDDGYAGVVDYEIYGIQDVMGWAPLVGGCAGDDGTLGKALLFFRGKVYNDAIVITVFSGPVKMGYGCGIAYKPVPGKAGVVTGGDGFREIYEIDGKPALDVWFDWSGSPREEILSKGAMFPYNQWHPIGVQEHIYPEWIWIKDPFRFIKEKNGLGVGGIVPVGTTIHLLEVTPDTVIQDNVKSLRYALDYEGIKKVAAMIGFNCVERLTILQTEEGKVTENFNAIMDVIGHPPIVGNAGAWGEQMFAPSGNIGAQNMTLCSLLIGDELIS